MPGTWESVGFAVGAWYGAVVWMATAPVIGIDGPLPIADAVWVAANLKNTEKSIRFGMNVGGRIDDWLADEPNQEINIPEEIVAEITPSITIIETRKSDGFYRRQAESEAEQTPEQTSQFFLYPYSERDSSWPEWND